ncbi:hypothetical protein WJX72_004220 [[Myrmecia] bisecta]|uniref:WW domain-containing protein n=1 Tax=[Myrmecia] bisecta TaxID=41462 RepID=A0AAW1Q721_9CHLO
MTLVAGCYERFLFGYTFSSATESKAAGLHRSFTYPAHQGPVKCVAVGAQLVASGGADDQIHLYDLQAGTDLGFLMSPGDGAVTAVKFYTPRATAAPTHLFSGSADGGLSIWKAGGGWECLKTLKGHRREITGLTIHPTGRLALTTSRDETLRMWDLVKGRCPYDTKVPAGSELVEFSTSGSSYASAAAGSMDIESQLIGAVKSDSVGPAPKMAPLPGKASSWRPYKTSKVAPAEPYCEDLDKAAPLENFIPFRFPDLRDRLVADFKVAFKEEAIQAQFKEFCYRLSLRNKLRLAEEYSDWLDSYAFMDPDVDVALPLPGSKMTAAARDALTQDFTATLGDVLAKSSFEELGEEELQQAFDTKGLVGMVMRPPNPTKLEYHIYFRGFQHRDITYKNWRTLWKTRHVRCKVYQRLVILFRMRDPAPLPPLAEGKPVIPPQERLEQTPQQTAWSLSNMTESTFGAASKALVKVGETMKSITQKGQPKSNPVYWYMKMFKEVDQTDLDMLLPGGNINLSYFDLVYIWVPVLAGLVSAIYKAATSSTFNSAAAALTSLILIIMPLTYAYKAYEAVAAKQAAYRAHLNKVLLLHNLNNNKGVMTQLVDEASEQEDNEALLAYFFLWRGSAQPATQTIEALDASIEEYLKAVFIEHSIVPHFDFQVKDALEKLQRVGLVHQISQPDGSIALQVVPLEEALNQLHIAKHASKGHAESGALPEGWEERWAIYPPSGQKIKFYWNASREESRYDRPSV